MHFIALENTHAATVCNVPEIGSKIRRLHRIWSGRFGLVRDGGRFLSKIGEDHQKSPFFIGGGDGIFISWAAKTGVQAFRAMHGLSRENHETCRN